MLELKDLKLKYTDRWDNNERRETHLYFEFPDNIAKQLVTGAGMYANTYAKALKDNNITENVQPYIELQLCCPFGECVESLGTVDLGIGIFDEEIEILDIISLIPEQDYRVKDILQLWSRALAEKY